MILSPERTLNRQHFTVIPITQAVIDRVNQLGQRENQPEEVGILDGHEVKVEENDSDEKEEQEDKPEDYKVV